LMWLFQGWGAKVRARGGGLDDAGGTDSALSGNRVGCRVGSCRRPVVAACTVPPPPRRAIGSACRLPSAPKIAVVVVALLIGNCW